MAQGEAISLLLRMSQMGDSKTYEAAAQRAVRAFIHSVSAGGVVQAFPDGAPAFEEYPTSPRSLVLNGFLFALLGLRDYGLYFGDAPSQKLFELCIAGLKKNLLRYDTGFWSLYDLHPTRRLASAKYVRIHVQLLQIFADITGDEFFAQVAKRWSAYLDKSSCRARFAVAKVFEKIRLHRKSDF
jgi:heparosan-N-sulfate-glucuronate 5-epimerase